VTCALLTRGDPGRAHCPWSIFCAKPRRVGMRRGDRLRSLPLLLFAGVIAVPVRRTRGQLRPFLPSPSHQPLSTLLLDECHGSVFFAKFANCALIRRPNHSLAQFAQPIRCKPHISPTASNRNPMCGRPALPCSMHLFTLPPTRGCKSVRQPQFCAFRCHSSQNCGRSRRTAHARGTRVLIKCHLTRACFRMARPVRVVARSVSHGRSESRGVRLRRRMRLRFRQPAPMRSRPTR